MKQLESELEAIVDLARDSVHALADKWRTRTLIPFCRRHRLTFASGMGTYVFYRNDNPVYAEDIKAIAQLEGTLSIEVLHRDDWFGLYVRDVTDEDLWR